MKGGIAAFTAAALDHVAQGRLAHGSIVFLITGDEEGPSVNGTVKLLDWATRRGERFDSPSCGISASRVSALRRLAAVMLHSPAPALRTASVATA